MSPPPRQQLDFNGGWEFWRDYKGEVGPSLFTQSGGGHWTPVDLPHTPILEPLVKVRQWQGTCMYRKFFSFPQGSEEQEASLRFEGAMQVCWVYLDGTQVGHHEGGYLPFFVELPRRAAPGRKHCVLVKLDNTDDPSIPPGKPLMDLDFNFYGGLYREATLLLRNQVHAAHDLESGGLRVELRDLSPESASLRAEMRAVNALPTAVGVTARFSVEDSGGVIMRANTDSLEIAAGGQVDLAVALEIPAPHRWSPSDPHLYRVTAEVICDGHLVDRISAPLGLRRLGWARDGFYLNGERLWLNGVNRHQEYPYIGYALSDRAQRRDAWKIRLAGFNLVRCSHYPPSSAFLDACDEFGLLVIDAIPGWQFFGGKPFQRRALEDVRQMVRRDRHHPCIVAWEASLNETEMSDAFMVEARRTVLEEMKPTEAFTSGFLDGHYDIFAPARSHDPEGNGWRSYARERPIFIAEYGDWEYYAGNAGLDQPGYANLKPKELSSRQRRGDGETRLAQQARNFQEAFNDIRSGPAVGCAAWVMFDYKRGYAPDIEASGLMDIFRLPKPVFYFYRSQASPQADRHGFSGPMVHISTTWSDDSPLSVVVYSNCDEVELQRDTDPPRRQFPDRDALSTHLPHPPFTFRFEAFRPGTLKAVGYIDGRPQAAAIVATPGRPEILVIDVDVGGSPLSSGENDVVFVRAACVDASGTPTPRFSGAVTFMLEGDAELLGENPVHAEAGIASILMRAGRSRGGVLVTATADGVRPAERRVDVE